MMKTKSIYNIYYQVLLFMYIYGFHIRVFGFNSVKIVLALIVIECIYHQRIFIKKLFVYLALYLSVIVFFAYAKTAYVGFYDITFPRNMLLILIEDLGLGILFGSILILRGYSVSQILDMIINVIVFQSIIIILMYVFDPFKDFLLGIQKTSQAYKSISEETPDIRKFRGLGLSYHLFYDFGFLQSFGLVLIMYKYLVTKKLSTLSIIKYLTIFITIFVIARTGLIGIIVSLILFIYTTLSNNKLLTMVFLRNALIIVSFFLLLPIFLPKSIMDDFNDNIYPWFFEWYENYKTTGKFYTSSSSILAKKMYYKLDDALFWYGNGIYKRGSASFAGLTDAGYMRLVIYFGIIGSVVLYVYYVIMMIMSYIYGELKYRWIVIIFILCLFIVHYKGDVFSGSPLNLRFLHLFFIVLVIEQSLIKKTKNILTFNSQN